MEIPEFDGIGDESSYSVVEPELEAKEKERKERSARARLTKQLKKIEKRQNDVAELEKAVVGCKRHSVVNCKRCS